MQTSKNGDVVNCIHYSPCMKHFSKYCSEFNVYRILFYLINMFNSFIINFIYCLSNSSDLKCHTRIESSSILFIVLNLFAIFMKLFNGKVLLKFDRSVFKIITYVFLFLVYSNIYDINNLYSNKNYFLV